MNSYYTLIASLPALPRLRDARRLPINRIRFIERLKMLKPEDAEVVKRAWSFFNWRNQPAETTDAQMIERHRRLEDLSQHASFGALFQFFSDLKTITVALRRRHLGRPRPAAREPWGIGQWVGHIERNWNDPDLRLAPVFPWIPQVRGHIEKGEIGAMERVIFGVEWDFIDRRAQGAEFGFDAVVNYMCKWDILDRWLSYNAEQAQVRFQKMLAEVANEHERLFD